MQTYSKNLKELSQKLRSDQTDAERKLWQKINRDQLLGFRFNRQNLLHYIVDFYCAKAKLVIELDGSIIMSQIIKKKISYEMIN